MTTTRWCFQCAAEYTDEAETCTECGVGLVDEPPLPPEEVGGEDDDQLAYELHAWAFESRRMVDQLLTADEIPHAWQGATLVVLEVDEDEVDAIIDEVERSTLPTLDPTLEKIEYDLDGWSAAQQTKLSDELGLVGIPNEFNADGHLLVHAIDEVRADEVVERLTSPDVEGYDESDLVELGGHEVGELLTDVFVAADRLRKAPDDFKARSALLAHGERLVGARAPFGFSSQDWGGLRDRCSALMAVVSEETTDDDHEEIVGQAVGLRDALHTLI